VIWGVVRGNRWKKLSSSGSVSGGDVDVDELEVSGGDVEVMWM
jgi:hypothetical protein